MSTRRQFLTNAAAVSLVQAAAVRSDEAAQATNDPATSAKTTPAKTGKIRHAGLAGSRIKAVIRREETIVRYGGNGDDYWATWAADDRQYIALEDGIGWSKDSEGFYNSRLIAVAGGPGNATFQDVAGYPMLLPQGEEPRYYGFGTLALDERIYQYLCVLEGFKTGARWVGAKLIYSADNGRSWRNQDGSTPVIWESNQSRSRKTMVFFKESQEAFSLLSILQMGRNYEANRDGYVYVYGTNGNTDGLINQLVMFRVPKAKILYRDSYEYFAGMKPDGSATWAKDIEARAVVHTFPRGWINSGHPDENVLEAWLPSVVYDAPLGLYLMANWGAGCAPDGRWFAKPSYLGFWVAANPWGPWAQIHEETVWTPGHDPAARCYAAVIAPKWIAPDGRSFWLVWTDFQGFGEYIRECRRIQEGRTHKGRLSRDEMLRIGAMMRRTMPYYAFNTQRVDLIVA